MGNIPFATVSDPLSLAATLVQIIDAGGLGGVEPATEGEATDSNGFPKQWDVRGLKDEGTVRYNPLGALTFASGTAMVATTAVAWFGQTCGIYVVRSLKSGRTNKDHATLDVGVKGVIQSTKTHAWPTP
jgi:hypothetical protein